MAAVLEMEAEEYLQENRIPELINNLTSLLLYHRPERPREFLIKQLEKLKYARLSDVDYPCLFDDSNLDAIFGILDPAGQGYITGTQYMEALKTLGIDVRNVEEPGGKITLELFKHGMRIQLKSACATFKS
ncbi:hypothetical protein XENTR_v10008769 [Xenopus tropicalis]|uniref:EF-hand calcium binding domain 10 n=1 Tax=Xenopus tropicalis TaxID=8364 RepID=A0A6I8SJT0_XENTR|eukprot:XP_004913071.1 PREDICTED: EF-hand calcium-binding domain-containing protein 10 [Xenopus tropicalis]